MSGTEHVQRLMQSYGGESVFFRVMEQRQAEFMKLWLHDATEMGRVLHAQLVVEHFLLRYLSFTNPNLPPLDSARLTFAQKAALLPNNNPLFSELKSGMKILGRIRNRLAHTLKVEVTEDDANALLGLAFFRAMLEAGDKRFGRPDRSALELVERYAQFAASIFQSASESDSHHWQKAFGPASSEGNA